MFSKLRSFFIVLLVVLSVLVSSQAVFSTPVSPWTQLGADIDGEAVSDLSGWSVAMSDDGSRVAIGAIYNDGNGTDSGHVRIYSWNGTAWTQLGADIDGEAADDLSGYSVAMSDDGSRVAIGATYNDGNGNNSGHVRIYSWNGTAWTQLGADIDGEAVSDRSGWSVAMSSDGSRVAIGALYNDGNGNNSGHARIYSWNGTAWTQLGADIDGEAVDDLSGSSVAMSDDGSRVAIGAYANDGNGNDSGHVRVYESLILASLSFDAISGANGPETITNVGGSSVTIPETEPTLNGQIFQGWNTKSDGTGTPYDAGDLITMPGAGQTLTLYASWAAPPTTTTTTTTIPPTTTTTTTTIPPTTTTEASAESGDDPAYAG
ncbi:MAG TPA: InlB B-repeat-containing protein [Acidimicrobiales bacterium]|nr:InlB B-repeat-containing protein [Acidimicrobiales bacterium]